MLPLSQALQPVFCRATVNAVFWSLGSSDQSTSHTSLSKTNATRQDGPGFLAKQAKVRKNRVLQLIFKALACCLWCFEKCLKFLNKPLVFDELRCCAEAQNAFFLILRNILRFGALAMLGSLLYFIGAGGVLVISGATGVGGYYILKALHPQINPIVPTILYVILGYLIGRLFLTVFGLACDTSLQCFIMSEDGTEMRQRGDFVPSALQSLMEKQDLGTSAERGTGCNSWHSLRAATDRNRMQC
eukprot:Skav218469  [mRNA]  locus=scaffold538:961360:964601:+ [translate_table: standard]